MGISEIERKLSEKRAYLIKAIQLRLEQLLSSTNQTIDYKEVVNKLIDEFGLRVIEDENILSALYERLAKKNIKPKVFFSQIVLRKDIFKKSFLNRIKIDYEKLGEYLYQHAFFSKKEKGGLYTTTELIRLFGDDSKVSYKDIIKAIQILEKKKLIPGRIKLTTGVELIQFIPFELSDDHKVILNYASKKGWVTLEELVKDLNWPLERVKIVLENLISNGIAKMDPSYSKGNRYYFPAFMINRNKNEN
ncbi:MAG: hypothetical protein ACTSYR_05360 [Candidatus Odinarchaeia archaeon]